MPASEVAAIGARESAGTETADGSALPITVIDVLQSDFSGPGIFERGAEGAFPGGFWDIIAGPRGGGENQDERGHETTLHPRLEHGTLQKETMPDCAPVDPAVKRWRIML
jgi:hypothetical protein